MPFVYFQRHGWIIFVSEYIINTRVVDFVLFAYCRKTVNALCCEDSVIRQLAVL
jgi:hypothetical protein